MPFSPLSWGRVPLLKQTRQPTDTKVGHQLSGGPRIGFDPMGIRTEPTDPTQIHRQELLGAAGALGAAALPAAAPGGVLGAAAGGGRGSSGRGVGGVGAGGVGRGGVWGGFGGRFWVAP